MELDFKNLHLDDGVREVFNGLEATSAGTFVSSFQVAIW
jgi:hypothetical protein